jgi:seryl-tRNA synthetase
VNTFTNAAVLIGLAAILYTLRRISMDQAALAQQIRDLTAQNEKAAAEQRAALKKLQDALDAAGSTTPEVDAALSELKASIQAEDDANPDAEG